MSSSMVLASPLRLRTDPAPKDAFRPEVADPPAIGVHLAVGLDAYQAARDAFMTQGPQALLDHLPELSDANRSHLKIKVQSLSPLPEITLEGENTLVIGNSIRADLISLHHGATLKINGETVTITPTSDFEKIFADLNRIVSAEEKISWQWQPSIINEAHAKSSLKIVLAAVGITLAALFGLKAYRNYQDKKSATSAGYLPENASAEQLAEYQKKYSLSADGSRAAHGRQSFTGSIGDYFRGGARQNDYKISPSFYNGGTWGKAIEASIRGLPQPSLMMRNPPPELVKECPKFVGMTDSEKMKAWTVIFDAIGMAESGHDPRTSYPESFTDKPGGERVVSRGVLQISWASARGHGGVCGNATPDLLHNPEYNLACGVQIMEDQLRVRGKLTTPGSSYYWSTLNPNTPRHPVSKINGFDKFATRFSYLRKDPSRWPAACSI